MKATCAPTLAAFLANDTVTSLPPTAAETLAIVRERGAVSAVELAPLLHGLTPSTANNRLEWLRRRGFVTRRRDGRRIVYTARAAEKSGAAS